MGDTTTIDAQFYDTIGDITTNTNRRDVSGMLDQWAHKSTPFLNRLSWGPDTGGLNIEWITEHLGFGYIQPASVIASAGGSIKVGSSGLASAGLAVKQINTGALLFGYSSTDSEICLINVTEICGDNTLECSWILPTACAALSLDTTDLIRGTTSVGKEM